MSISVGVPPDGLGGRLCCSHTHVVVASWVSAGLLDHRPLFFSDLTGGGSQSLATRLFNMADSVIKAARETLASRCLVMQLAGLPSQYCCHVLCVTDRFPWPGHSSGCLSLTRAWELGACPVA